MCGLAGFLGASRWGGATESREVLQRMGSTIVSRGPDDAGYWHDTLDGGGVGFAHRRLAIVDLSTAGHQPMSCHSGRFVIAFNGEIYNHLDLRTELTIAGYSPAWRGHSDTETLLAAFLAWGVRATLERCIGMFAFALWDRKEQRLYLGRDRLGEKPLYYGWQGDGDNASFIFGSELKALRVHPAFTSSIDRNALALLMRYSYINAPYSIYQGIYKLQPGCLLSVSLTVRELKVEQYWSLADVAVSGSSQSHQHNPDHMIDELEVLLKSAVKQQMMADVPLGAFLSGGIDSSTVVALMQSQADRPVKTFTIGFHEDGYNEARHAIAVAKHLGTEHTELYVTPQQALDVIPKLPALYCEPFSDSSQIPTFLVSQLARQHVTVSLSGDAGDELFAGYNRYIQAKNSWGTLSHIPIPLRKILASAICAISPSQWNVLLGGLQSMLPASLRMSNVGDKLHKAAHVLAANTIDELYLGLVSHWEPDSLVLAANEPCTDARGSRLPLTGLDDVQRMMVLDALAYLPGDILTKVDRAAMGVSLETRVPFLDHRVVEFAWRVPQSMKLRNGQGKWILRQVLYRHVPQELIERPKMGFGVPIDTWLRGPLRGWAEDLLSETRLRQDGFFNPVPIRQKWAEHLSGKRNWQSHLWDVLMFQAWLSEQ